MPPGMSHFLDSQVLFQNLPPQFPMIRILTAIVASVFALLSVSCLCCTGEAKPPGLRPLTQFKEIQTTQEVHYSK